MRDLPNIHTWRFIMFSMNTNICNNKAKGPTLMELFRATGKLKKLILQLEKFDVCTTGDTAHIDTIFKFLPHTRQHGCINILHCNDPCLWARIIAAVNFFSFPVAVNSSIKVGPLVFLL
jgi:hypothetical protein